MRFLCSVTLLSLLIGCSSPPPSPVVRGKVMMDGQPLSSAQVQLMPKDSPGGSTYTTVTKEDGTFEIRPTNAQDRPVAEGKYAVTVTKTGAPKGAKAGEMATVVLTPAIYGDRTKTPLAIEVKTGSNELPTIELTSTK